MLRLVNLSNYADALKMVEGSNDFLQTFLREHQLDGLEMIFSETWDEKLPQKDLIYGAHLWFWNDWLDFWYGDIASLVKNYGSEEKIVSWFGGLKKENWLELYRNNIIVSQKAAVKYLVFHVSNARISEIFNRQYHFSDKEVIDATIELVNILSKDISPDVELLFENLWWPGLTLLDKQLVAYLLANVKHPNCGIMLDTGHLLNTCPTLESEEEGIDYLLNKIENLGEYKKYIKGIHLNCSLSGQYVKEKLAKTSIEPTMQEVFEHVQKIDQHLPFTNPRIKEVVHLVKPKYLVHEFITKDRAVWSQRIKKQQNLI